LQTHLGTKSRDPNSLKLHLFPAANAHHKTAECRVWCRPRFRHSCLPAPMRAPRSRFSKKTRLSTALNMPRGQLCAHHRRQPPYFPDRFSDATQAAGGRQDGQSDRQLCVARSDRLSRSSASSKSGRRAQESIPGQRSRTNSEPTPANLWSRFCGKFVAGSGRRYTHTPRFCTGFANSKTDYGRRDNDR